MNRLFHFMILYLLTHVYNVASKNSVFSLSLVSRKSPLEMLISDPNRTKKFGIEKKPPTNENITLFKYLDSEYYAEILVGKPGQKFTVIFDTTWADMWIPSKLCSEFKYPICNQKHKYDANVSSTHKSIEPAPFEVAGLVGNLTCDTVRLGHLNVSDLIFAEVREIHDIPDYQNMHADGIIGLGFQNMARTTKNTFFYKLLADGKIKKPIFSVYFNRDDTTPKGGTIFLGGIDPKHMQGPITYLHVTKMMYWQVNMNQFSVQINKTNSRTFCNKPCSVIIDTGSNKIGVPKNDVVVINNLIGAEEYLYNRYAVPCSMLKKLPTITLNFAARVFHTNGKNYIQKIENGINGTVCITAFCESELTQDGIWTLGGAFLSSVYTTFDLQNNRIGFANLRHNSTHYEYDRV